MTDNNDNCTLDSVYPFVLTHKTGKTCIHAFDNNPWLGSKNCNDCACFCFPFTIVFDILTLVPFTGIYICKKTCCKSNVITTQPTK